MDKTFSIGATAFFKDIPEYKGKPDTLVLEDDPQGYEHYSQSTEEGCLTVKWARKSKADFLAYAKRGTATAYEFGKFIIPGFIEEYALTMDDVEDLYAHFEPKMRIRLHYQKYIMQAYRDNGGFTLTDEQLAAAFETYKQGRPDIYPEDEPETEGDTKSAEE